MTDELLVKTGDLVPGSFKGSEGLTLYESPGYFPKFNWDVLIDPSLFLVGGKTNGQSYCDQSNASSGKTTPG